MNRLASLLMGIALCVAALPAQPQPKPDPKDTGKKAHKTPQAMTKSTKQKADTKKGAQTKKGQSTNVQGKKGGNSAQ